MSSFVTTPFVKKRNLTFNNVNNNINKSKNKSNLVRSNIANELRIREKKLDNKEYYTDGNIFKKAKP